MTHMICGSGCMLGKHDAGQSCDTENWAYGFEVSSPTGLREKATL